MNLPNIMLSLFALNILDAWSTILCVSRGFTEANPFLRFLLDVGLFIEYKFLFGLGLLVISFYYSKRVTENYSLMRYSLLSLCVIYSSTIWSNLQLIV
jgi:hypothetical protein